eukprot:gene11021-14802_t
MAQSWIATLLVTVALGTMLFFFLYLVILLSRRWKSVLQDRLANAIKKRRNYKDNFREVNGFSWDYFITFKVYDEFEGISEVQAKYGMRTILTRLAAAGLETRLFYSVNHKLVFCKIRCPLIRLQKQADLIDYKLTMDSDQLRRLCKQGREGFWEPLTIPDKCDQTSVDPYEYIYMRYEFDEENEKTNPQMNELYKRWPKIEIGSENDSKYDVYRRSDKNIPRQSVLVPISNPLSATKDVENTEPVPIDPGPEHLMFRGVDRLKLMHSIISSFGPGGACLDPYQLLKDECILSYSPLHDMVELQALEAQWVNVFSFPWSQPIDEIKDYFGEKIGLYFTWLGMYTSWLIPASIVAVLAWIYVAYEDNDPNAPDIPYFAGFMSLWSVLFLESWKRKEKFTAMRWGTIGFEATEQERPQFSGEMIKSAINGRPVKYFDRTVRSRRNLLSNMIILFLVLIVIAVIALIFTIRIEIALSGFEIGGVGMASIIASILIALQVQILNAYFGDVALSLNNYENYRTDALIAKTFSFQFVNSYASLFYISFVKPYIQQTDPCVGSCMLELQTTLGTIFLTRLAVGNLTELGIPLAKIFLKNREGNENLKVEEDKHMQQYKQFNSPSREPSIMGVELLDNGYDIPPNEVGEMKNMATPEDAKHEISEIEKSFNLETYDIMLGTFEDYAEMIIQFGYTTMFIAGFPLATLMSLINNYVEIRVDAWKLCQLMRRPEPRGAEDIGTWYDILEVVSTAAIFINSGIVAFTGTPTINYSWALRVWIFILMSTGLF